MEKTIEEKLILFSKEYIDSEKINFEWEDENSLRYVSDESLELAYEILQRYKFSLEAKDDKILIYNNLENLCSYKYTTSDLLNKIKNEKKIIKETTFTVKKDLTIDRICYNCKFQKCPKHLAGYIFYLINKGLLIEKLEERRIFRENKEINEKYAFEWKYGDILRIIPNDIYSFCYKIAKQKLVYVEKYLTKDKKLKIYSSFTCSDYKLMFGNIEKIKNENKEFGKWTHLIRNPNSEIKLCDSYSCSMRGCPFAIAGIIYYLIDSGREDILELERKYYEEHQEEMDKELDEIIEKKNKDLKENINESTENLKKYENKIDKFDELISILINQNQKSLHCTIEGNDIEERKKLIDNIVDVIFENKRIEKENYIRVSLQNFVASNAYSSNEKIHEKSDINGIPYKGENLIKFTGLKEDYIYVLTNLDEFIKDYREFKNLKSSYLYGEVRKKQHEYAIKLLTEISHPNCIILDATSKEIDELLQLEPRLQYIYQNSRFKIQELSMEETFELYSKSLNNKLFNKLKKDEEVYKKQFMEYISLNKNFIPFTNRELASYLSLYSNSKGDVVFPENIYKKESIDEALENIVGLEEVKEKVKEFEKYMMFKVKAEAEGLKLSSSNMHMIFTGNPGTGKTTIARIMAKMLFDMGIITENKLVEVERKDLVAEYIGQTAVKTSEVISSAMGGVLFIDEAYSLAGKGNNDFGGEAIATLIKAMEDYKDKFVVIFAGYKDEMKSFIDINPGIASRIGYTFDFEDYKTDELVEIFYKKLKNMGFCYTEDCDLELRKLCTYFSQRKAFGNGRFVDKLIQEVILKHAINDDKNIKQITIKDIPTIRDFNNTSDPEESTEELLENVIGMEDLKLKIKEFESYAKFIKEAQKNNINIPNQNLHMIFTGNPGTGKTTVARIMAKILYNTGIIQENKLIEVERKDLIAEYIGHTAIKTYEVIEKALGGVLFIDEAYSLAGKGNNDFGGEAIATLIKAMEDHKGQLIVIFAGYRKEMGEFINMNSGIASRIGYNFDFLDYTREELAEILYKKLEKSNFKINEKAREQVLSIMNYFCNVENIGNGRFADKVFQQILLKHAKRIEKDIGIIEEEDIPSIKEMTKSLFNGNWMIDPNTITEEDLKETAIHEVGHAIVRYKLYKTPGIIKITINPEGNGTLGYVRHKITEGKYVSKKSMLLNRITVSLAGMAAEEVFLGEFANGNTSDLQKATKTAKNMITKYGMSDLGLGQIDEKDGLMTDRVQEEINAILKGCYDQSIEIINQNKMSIIKVVDYLMKEKEITEEEFIEIVNS